jgi:hypothetical protein
MKKMIFLVWLILFLPAMVWGQEKVGAPVWNVGDKWVFNREGPMEVVGSDAQSYSVKFSGGLFPKDASGIAIFERSALNITHLLNGNERKRYSDTRRMIFNFPLTIGKQWKGYYETPPVGTWGVNQWHETYQVLGWEDINVRPGKFKSIKLEYKIEKSTPRTGPTSKSKAWYWYSPEIKNIVKCQYEKGYDEGMGREDWELISFQLKK